MGFAQFGNDLHTGRRQFDFVGRRKLWYTVSAVLLALSLLGLFGRGLNLGLEFTGGSDFRVAGVSDTTDYEARAARALDAQVGAGETVRSSVIGGETVRVQTGSLEGGSTGLDKARSALAQEFDVPAKDVAGSLVGPSWGKEVSRKAVIALGVFLGLVSLVLALYFRTWKMALAALVALLHDLVFTVGAFALAGFEVSPASVIGFLTILGYSLYDTVVVFDKLRENVDDAMKHKNRTYAQAANTAVNQTLVRSINTSVVALLPVAAILAVGFGKLGPGTLLDLSLALFIGIAVGTFSSIFIATPLLVQLRQGEPGIRAHDAEVRQRQRARAQAIIARKREAAAAPAGASPEAEDGDGDTVAGPDAATTAVPVAAGAPSTGEGRTIATGRPRHPAAWGSQ
ncbi:protein translocase subunit SecF [Kytococcus schroeteri]|uniref:Protein-export membrane protein SecF n=2 Tax=Kytococcus TaxID=57499 RepID=A0A2I1PDK9_9MICO|nr:protein translocase subunit SecF [Kytococcus schroeteri]PKZ42717.1 protein translocase subunit SecF [Kytococcus schroeteri]